MKDKKFTVILTFLNEGDEVYLTCKSVRETCGDKVDIVVINDNSDDGYDYVKSLKDYNVKYFKTQQRLGCSVCRNMGVNLTNTPYFLILDAHCRMYTKDWLDKAIAIMERKENAIYCCSVQYFFSEDDHKDNKNVIAYGAYFPFNKEKPLNASWNVRNLTKENEDTFRIPCLMGANYICSKKWWNHLNGLNGITMWGCDEEFISLKSYLAGGEVKCITNILTAHKGRKEHKRPYVCFSTEVYHNELSIGYIILNEHFEKIVDALRKKHNDYIFFFDKVYNEYMGNIEYYDRLKKKFKEIKKITIEEFNSKINNPFIESIKKPIKKVNKV